MLIPLDRELLFSKLTVTFFMFPLMSVSAYTVGAVLYYGLKKNKNHSASKSPTDQFSSSVNVC